MLLDYWASGPLRFNIVKVDLGAPNIRATPALANQFDAILN